MGDKKRKWEQQGWVPIPSSILVYSFIHLCITLIRFHLKTISIINKQMRREKKERDKNCDAGTVVVVATVVSPCQPYFFLHLDSLKSKLQESETLDLSLCGLSVCVGVGGWVVLLTARTHGIECCITHISRGNQSSSRHNCYFC